MKKCIAVLLTILAMSFCLSFTVSANAHGFTLSEDLMTLTLNGENFVRMDTSCTSTFAFETLMPDLQPTPDQQEQFKDWTFTISEDGRIIDASFYYRVGGTLYCQYVREDFAPQLVAYQNGTGADCRIEIGLDPIIIPESTLKGKPVTLSGNDLMWSEQYDVCADVSDEYLYINTGTLLVQEGTFYYVDHSDLNHYPGYLDPYEYTSLNCYEITDEALCQQLSEYGLGGSGLENLVEMGIGALVLFIFGLIPAAILVLGLVMLIKRKGYYRIIWGITAGFCIAELITFVIVLSKLLP